MHIVLTDILTCPVCGPDYGLILRSDHIADRRVLEGALGCPHCHRNYAVHEGIAYLDAETTADATPRERGERSRTGVQAPPDSPSAAEHAEEALRIAALLDLQKAGGFILVAGPAAAHAAALAARVPGLEVIAVAGEVHAAVDPPGVSRMVIGAGLPIHHGKLRGIWLSGAYADSLLEEAARALHATARLALEPTPHDARERIESRGLRVMLHEKQTLLAQRMMR